MSVNFVPSSVWWSWLGLACSSLRILTILSCSTFLNKINIKQVLRQEHGSVYFPHLQKITINMPTKRQQTDMRVQKGSSTSNKIKLEGYFLFFNKCAKIQKNIHTYIKFQQSRKISTFKLCQKRRPNMFLINVHRIRSVRNGSLYLDVDISPSRNFEIVFSVKLDQIKV